MRVSSYFNYEKKRLELSITGDGGAEDALLWKLHIDRAKPEFVQSTTQPMSVSIAIPIEK